MQNQKKKSLDFGVKHDWDIFWVVLIIFFWIDCLSLF